MPFEPESFLICSDGLSDQVSSPEIARIVYEHPDDPATIVGRLVQAANEAGGKDNVTAVFFAGERFAEVARREWPRRAASPEDHDTPRTRARERGRWFLSPPLLAGYGVLAGVALAALSFVLLEPVAGWLLEQSRPASWARTWRVEPEGGGDAATIGEALRLASPGDTISVAPGEYREGVLVDRDLTLVSRNPRQARLAPGGGRGNPGRPCRCGPSRFRISDSPSPRAVAPRWPSDRGWPGRRGDRRCRDQALRPRPAPRERIARPAQVELRTTTGDWRRGCAGRAPAAVAQRDRGQRARSTVGPCRHRGGTWRVARAVRQHRRRQRAGGGCRALGGAAPGVAAPQHDRDCRAGQAGEAGRSTTVAGAPGADDQVRAGVLEREFDRYRLIRRLGRGG